MHSILVEGITISIALLSLVWLRKYVNKKYKPGTKAKKGAAAADFLKANNQTTVRYLLSMLFVH